MAEDGLPAIVDVGVTHSLADTYFSQNTSVGVRGCAADRYAKPKDTAMELEEPLTDAAAAYQRQKEADAAQHGEMAEVFAALRAALCVTRLEMMCAVKGELGLPCWDRLQVLRFCFAVSTSHVRRSRHPSRHLGHKPRLQLRNNSREDNNQDGVTRRVDGLRDHPARLRGRCAKCAHPPTAAHGAPGQDVFTQLRLRAPSA